MLDDKDRIFKNLYGLGDWGLEGARKRGSWDGTKAILEKGRDAIVATATPRAGVKPTTDDGKIMQHFQARAWINEADAEIARVEIEALDDLSFGWGLFARVHKGARAMYERRKINDEIWLPARVTWTGSARLFLVKQERMSGVSEFSNYRKFTVGTSTTYGAPPR